MSVVGLPKGCGDLRRRLVLRQPAWNQAASGATAPTYADVATVWASVEGQGGRELVQAQQVQPDAQYRIVIRYRTDVKEDWQLGLGGRNLNVLNVSDAEEQRVYLTILAAEQKQ